MYILIEDHIVKEIIPAEDPIFPGIPISGRYEPAFVQRLLEVPDGTEVLQNWRYDPESGTFSEPPPPPVPETESADDAQPQEE